MLRRALASACLLLAIPPLLTPAPGADLVPVLHSVSYAGVWRGQAKLSSMTFSLRPRSSALTV